MELPIYIREINFHMEFSLGQRGLTFCLDTESKQRSQGCDEIAKNFNS